MTALPHHHPSTSPPLKRHAHDPAPFLNPPTKRYRPNLAHGFSGLSLSQLSTEAQTRHEEYALDSPPDAIADIIEPELELDTPSSPSSTGTIESDATFRAIRPRPVRRQPSPHVIEPLSPPNPTVQMGHHKRACSDALPEGKRRKVDSMEIDEDMEAIPRKSRTRTRTQWHEPEKDRIVITSLGSPNSSRGSSPDISSANDHHLSQPGAQGFTLNPSFLTHLLNTQKNDMYTPAPPPERNLVLYRPVPWTTPATQGWEGQEQLEDSSRFQVLDDDDEVKMEQDGDDWAEPMDIE